MSVFLNKLVNDDFLWDAISSHLPKFKRSATSFLNFNCPECNDYKPRCGVKRSTRIGVSCYNCGFKCGYQVGQPLTYNMCRFLRSIGVDEIGVKRLKLQAQAIRLALRDSTQIPENISAITFDPNFPTMALPKGSKPLLQWADEGCVDPDFIVAVDYAMSRGDVVFRTTDFHWSPEPIYRNRLIIPFWFRNRIVGYTARSCGPSDAKYLNFMPSDYLYNSQVLDIPDREYALLVEGVLDAKAIDGVSPLGSKINENQAVWLKNSGKRIIVVADRDEAGQKMIDLARKHNWAVSFPALKSNNRDWWDDDIKDCDDAVKRHGRLFVLRSILENVTTNATEIEVKRRYLS